MEQSGAMTPEPPREPLVRLGALLQRIASRREAEATPDVDDAMLWMSGPDGRCVFMSRGWTRFTGQPQSEALGGGWMALVHADDRERAARVYDAALARREPYAVDYRLRRSDGAWRWVLDSGRPRRGTGGEFAGHTGSVLDVHAIVDVEGEENLISFRDLLRWLHEGRRWVTLADGSVVEDEIGDGASPRARWGEAMGAPLTDVFEVQADIARQVAAELGVALGADAREHVAERPTDNLAAYDAYLQGEAVTDGFGTNNPPLLRTAVAHYERATALDPRFALAWARLSQAKSLTISSGDPSKA